MNQTITITRKDAETLFCTMHEVLAAMEALDPANELKGVEKAIYALQAKSRLQTYDHLVEALNIGNAPDYPILRRHAEILRKLTPKQN